jgi:hypothetical protein
MLKAGFVRNVQMLKRQNQSNSTSSPISSLSGSLGENHPKTQSNKEATLHLDLCIFSFNCRFILVLNSLKYSFKKPKLKPQIADNRSG